MIDSQPSSPTTAPRPRSRESTIPKFEPHPWVQGGHRQTILVRYLPAPRIRLTYSAHEVEVDGGDRLSVLESIPEAWSAGMPAAVLVHGLAGCAEASYMMRVSSRLLRLGIRVVRMNLRGAGAGFGLARGIYHAGRTEDLRRVAEWLEARIPGSPIAMVGFSLGGNLVLKLAAEAVDAPVAGFDCVLAANPPVDLAACSRQIRRLENRIYDRYFVRLLRAEVARLHATFPELGPVDLGRTRTLLDFDDAYTAPRNGFASVDDYYRRSSAAPSIPRIQLPGLVVHSEDDPFIPASPFREIRFPANLTLELVPSGGHLGYFSRRPWDGDRRWLDARLAAWLVSRWEGRLPDRLAAI